MKVVLAGGGTGGHVYPSISVARALADELEARGETLHLLYIGVRGRVDEVVVPRAGIPHRAVAAGQLRVASSLTLVRNMLKLAFGTLQSAWIIARFRPQVVFATGGYASVPAGIAAWALRRPLVVYLPDVTPGWAVRLLSRLATKMVVTSERAVAHLPPRKVIVTGYPVRADFWRLDRIAARAAFGLPAEGTVLLVTGASLGARAINEAVIAALPRLLARCDVLHLTGAVDEAWARGERTRLAPDLQRRYHVHDFTDEMPAAMAAADLAISRAGASVLGELPAARLPAILVPGEYEGWSQAPNAEYLQAEGAAMMLRNSELGRLGHVALELLDDERRLASMRAAMRRLARPEAARDIAHTLLEVAA